MEGIPVGCKVHKQYRGVHKPRTNKDLYDGCICKLWWNTKVMNTAIDMDDTREAAEYIAKNLSMMNKVKYDNQDSSSNDNNNITY